MTQGFDEDALGAVLEYGVLLRGHGVANERAAWETKSLRPAPRGAFDSAPDVWRGAALERGPLEAFLQIGRDREDVKRRLARVFATLERHHLIEPYPRDDNPRTLLREVTSLGEELVREDSHREYVCGLRFVVERWRDSIAYLYGAEGIGTGFFASPRHIVTARHVIEELKFKFSVGRGQHELAVGDVRLPKQASGDLDLAVVELKEQVAGVEPMRLGAHVDELDEVVVFGYPPVPQTRDVYLVVNRGEVSAEVTLHNGYQAILVTCLLRGGYSGGPVVNRRGRVVGVVSRNLFKQVAPDEKSLNEALGLAAAVPAQWVQDLLDEKV